MTATLRIKGHRKLQRKLMEMGGEGKKAMRRALRAGAKVIQQEARARAPEGSDPRSPASRQYGPLKKQIKVRAARARRRGNIVITVNTGDAFYGKFVEYGTQHMAAKPFMRPAFDTKHHEAEKRSRDHLVRSILRAAQKGGTSP